MFKIVILVLVALIALFFLFMALKKKKKPVRAFFASALLGIGALLILHLMADITGVPVELDAVSLPVSAILGLPGAVLVLVSYLI